MNKKNRTVRRGFTMIEMSLVIVVGAVIFLGLYKLIRDFTENKGYAQETVFNQTINTGIKNSFIDILEAYQVRASTVVDSSANWGWTLSQNTSPFPISVKDAVGLPYLDYRLDTVGLSAPELARLQAEIVTNFQGACSKELVPMPNGNIRLFCPKLEKLEYNIGAPLPSATAHALNTPLNPSVIPIVSVFFKREYPTHNAKTPTTEQYSFTMDEIYNARRSVSVRRLNTLRTAMESFHNRTIVREVSNSVTGGGLNTMDDEFVPWIWKVFGDNAGSVNSINCIKAGVSCANLNSSNIWRTSLSNKGLFTNRVISNLLSGDRSFAIDGFNNPIFIYPLMGQCPVTTTNLMTCPAVAPPLPADNYLNVGSPPFVSAIYTPSFNNKTVIAPDYGRIYVSY